MYHNWELFIGVLCFKYCHALLSLSVFSLEGQCTLQLLRRICLQIIELSAGCPAENMISNSNILTYYTPSSETQGQSVGRGEKARRKFSSMGGKAPGYRLLPDHLQTVKRMLAPDWTLKKKLCVIVPNRRTVSPEFFSWARTRRLLSRSPLVCTKEMHAVRNLDSMDITKILAVYCLVSLLSALTKCKIKELPLAQMVSLL